MWLHHTGIGIGFAIHSLALAQSIRPNNSMVMSAYVGFGKVLLTFSREWVKLLLNIQDNCYWETFVVPK